MRCPGRPRLRTIPLRRFIPFARPASADRSERTCRPCGFTPCEHDAVKLDMRTSCRLRCRRSARRVDAGAKLHRNVGHVIGRLRKDRSVQPDDHARKRPVTSSATATLIRRPRSVMHRRFSWRDVPLPTRTFAAWHVEWSFPLLAVRRSWGFKSPFAGLLPPAGDRSSLIDRAHMPLRPAHAPIDFRRVRSVAA
jgi:hypothetical protein